MKQFLLREEKDGCGYLFDRNIGKADFVPTDQLSVARKRSDVDFLPLRGRVPQYARVAPFCVWVELTRRCNLHCSYCGAPDRDNIFPLTADQFDLILKQMADVGVFEVRLTGGEPTLHPEFCDIVNRVARNFFVSINSNGVLTNRKEFAALPVNLYILSLDGPQSANDDLRPDNSYHEVTETIRVLVSEGKHVRINTVLCRRNMNCLPEFVSEMESLGVEGLTLIPLRPAGKAEDIFEMLRLSREDYGKILGQLQEIRKNHQLEIAASYDTMSAGKIFNTPQHFTKRCVAGVEAACVGPDGSLRACILLDSQLYIVGNMLTEVFSELWADDKRWGIFRDERRLSKRCQSCDFFSTQCPGTCQAIAAYFGSPEQDPYCQLPLLNY